MRGCEEIANLLSGSRKQHNNIIRLLGDICQFGVTRTSNKAFIPMSLILTSAMTNVLYKAHFIAQNELTDEAITDEMIPVNLQNLDFSGHGLLAFWNSLRTFQFSLRGNPAILTPNLAGQALFHAVFGTHKENLNLLEWMTGQHFDTRREVGDKFQKRASSGMSVKTNIIPLLTPPYVGGKSLGLRLLGVDCRLGRQSPNTKLTIGSAISCKKDRGEVFQGFDGSN